MHFNSSLILRSGLLAIFATLYFSGCGGGETDPKAPGFVVAEGKGVKVTRAEVDEIKSHLFGNGPNKMKMDQIPPGRIIQMEHDIANQLVVKAILLQSADDIDGKDIDNKVEAELGRIKGQFPNEQAFQAKLAQANISMDQVRSDLASQIKMETVLRAKVPAVSDIPLAVVTKYYEEHKTEFNQPPTITARHILVHVPPNADAATKAQLKKKAEAARTRVNKGEDFGKVATEVSDDPGSKTNGGELPPFTHGRMVPEFEKVAFATKTGTISPVFETEFGYHFLKVTDLKPAATLPFEQAKELIVKEFANLERQKKVKEYIDTLIKQAEVVYHLPEIPKESGSPFSPMGGPPPPAGDSPAPHQPH